MKSVLQYCPRKDSFGRVGNIHMYARCHKKIEIKKEVGIAIESKETSS